MGDNATGTTGLIVQAAKDLGGWLGKHLDGPASEISGMIQDRLKFARAVRVVRLAERFKSELQAAGPNVTMQSLPPNFLLSALEEGALEEDDQLQDLWARLLANTCDASTGVSVRRSHITMLKDMTPFDAMVFDTIYSVQPDDGKKKGVLTYDLPNRAFVANGERPDSLPKPSHEVIVSISNLERIGAIKFGPSFGGGEVFDIVSQNVGGQELFKAIKNRAAP